MWLGYVKGVLGCQREEDGVGPGVDMGKVPCTSPASLCPHLGGFLRDIVAVHVGRGSGEGRQRYVSSVVPLEMS